MLPIYDVDTARRTILKRTPLLSSSYPASTLARTEELFGAGVTPPQAVSMILESVQKEGEAALRRWCELLYHIAPEDCHRSPETREWACTAPEPELLKAMKTAATRIRRCRELQPLPNWE